jgi:hypothetical protein
MRTAMFSPAGNRKEIPVMTTSRMLAGCFLLSVALSNVQQIGLAQEANPTFNPQNPTQVPNNGEPGHGHVAFLDSAGPGKSCKILAFADGAFNRRSDRRVHKPYWWKGTPFGLRGADLTSEFSNPPEGGFFIGKSRRPNVPWRIGGLCSCYR